MNSPKLLEAVAELEAQREIIDAAILHLRKAVVALGGATPLPDVEPVTVENVGSSLRWGRPTPTRGPSYTAQAEQAIIAAKHPLHINDIVEYITSIRGNKPDRSSVESGILRDIRKQEEKAKGSSKLFRSGPSTYDVRKSLSIAS